MINPFLLSMIRAVDAASKRCVVVFTVDKTRIVPAVLLYLQHGIEAETLAFFLLPFVLGFEPPLSMSSADRCV